MRAIAICDIQIKLKWHINQVLHMAHAFLSPTDHVCRVRNELNGFSIQRIECEFQSIQINSRIFNSNQLNFESIQTKYSRMRLLATRI